MQADALMNRLPTEAERGSAAAAVHALSFAADAAGGVQFSVSPDGERVEVALPPAVSQLVLDVLNHVVRGEMVTLVPYGSDLTTQQAADLLNVSRPFLIKLLESGEIPFHKTGAHRRVPADSLFAYKERRDREREMGLKELQRLGQEFDAA